MYVENRAYVKVWARLITSFVSVEIQYCPKLGAVLRIWNHI